MRLTPLDIHQKEFRRSLRGYNEEDVDAFLDEVAAEFERLFQENIDLREEVERLEKRLKQFENFEKTVQDSILAAQRSAEEMEQNARRSAELIVRDAELKAKEIVQESLARRQEIELEIKNLKEVVEEFRERMKGILESYSEILEKVGKESEKLSVVVQLPKSEEKVEATPSEEEKAEKEPEEAKEEASLEEELEVIPEASMEEG